LFKVEDDEDMKMMIKMTKKNKKK